jgi:hypothetical protein
VRVTNGSAVYDSHKRIATLETDKGDGVTVNWTEPLFDADGQRGGELRSSFRFHGPTIEMRLDLRALAGESRIDFHDMRRPNGFIRLWKGQEVADILAGRFLRTQGDYNDRKLKPGEPPLFAMQIDRTVFAFELIEAPPATTVMLVANPSHHCTPATWAVSVSGSRCRQGRKTTP